jgi:hypothetical protein
VFRGNALDHNWLPSALAMSLFVAQRVLEAADIEDFDFRSATQFCHTPPPSE